MSECRVSSLHEHQYQRLLDSSLRAWDAQAIARTARHALTVVLQKLAQTYPQVWGELEQSYEPGLLQYPPLSDETDYGELSRYIFRAEHDSDALYLPP